MRNLLHKPLSGGEITAILREAAYPSLLPPLGDKRWEQAARHPVIARWVAEISERAQCEIDKPLPELPDELYAEYNKSGYRLGFEKHYFERRRMLARAAVSLLFARATGNISAADAFQHSCIDKLTGIFNEESWALPAHTKGASSGKDPFQIDLFAAETANLMAEMLTLFGAVIPAALRRRILSRLRERIFENYLARCDEFPWTTNTSNWNAVCHQGIVGAALAVEEDLDLTGRVIERASDRMRAFVGGFTPDGGCTEGPAYWEYGFGWFSVLNEQLETCAGGELSLLDGDPHLRKVAMYAPHVSLAAGRLVNFSDSRSAGEIRPAVLLYLGDRLGEPALVEQGLINYRRIARNGINVDRFRGDLFFFLRHFLRCPDPAAFDREDHPITGDSWFPDLGVLVTRSRAARGRWLEWAAKAGHNGEHHNHNDCGSFMIHVDGQPLICELGAPEYTREFFQLERRYGFLAARSLGHSVPLVNGREQAPGCEFRSVVTKMRRRDDETVFEIDLTACYPDDAGLESCLRAFHLRRAAGVLEVRDIFSLSKLETLETAIITHGEVEMETDGRALIRVGDARCVIETSLGARIAEIQRHTYNDHDGNPAAATRIVIAPEKITPVTELRYAIHAL